MSDIADDIIETVCRAREQGLSHAACTALVRDVFAAPWSDTPVVINNHLRRRRWRTMSRPTSSALAASDSTAQL